MSSHMKKIFAFGAAILLAAASAHAQDPAAGYPSRPSESSARARAAPPITCRATSPEAHRRWGQPVIVDSRAGAGGTIPTDVVAKSPPDGYNLVMGHIGPMVSAVTLYAKNLPYDPAKDSSPSPWLRRAWWCWSRIFAAGGHRAGIHRLRQTEGDLAYGSAGNGSTSHLAGELLKKVSGSRSSIFPYKSAATRSRRASRASAGVFPFAPYAHGQLKAGKVKRSRCLPSPDPGFHAIVSRRAANRVEEDTASALDFPCFQLTMRGKGRKERHRHLAASTAVSALPALL